MTRSIPILTLTLALSTSVNAGDVLPNSLAQGLTVKGGVVTEEKPVHQYPGSLSLSALRTGVSIVDEDQLESGIFRQDELEISTDIYQPGEFEISPGDCTSALRDADDLELLVAFVAYEYGTEAACEMLLELGISPGDCVSALRTGVMIEDEGGGSN